MNNGHKPCPLPLNNPIIAGVNQANKLITLQINKLTKLV